MEDKSSEEGDSGVFLDIGTVVLDKWNVTKVLGEGGCGSVYEVVNRYDNKRAALKVEKIHEDKGDQVLRMEVHILKKLKNKEHICQLYSFGTKSQFNYIIMTLVGPTLHDLRLLCPQLRFTTSTTIRLGFQCLQGIETLHKIGFVHRDIKPSNFALGATLNTSRIVYLLDFGLARQCLVIRTNGPNMMRQPRAHVGFRGTICYCSVNVHRRWEHGRHDDIWSLMYMLIESIRAHLPWRNRTQQQTMELKATIEHRQLLTGCPTEFFDILTHLRDLSYMDKPDYIRIYDRFRSVVKRKCYKWDGPFDWERGGRFYENFKGKMNYIQIPNDHANEHSSSRINENTAAPSAGNTNIGLNGKNNEYEDDPQR